MAIGADVMTRGHPSVAVGKEAHDQSPRWEERASLTDQHGWGRARGAEKQVLWSRRPQRPKGMLPKGWVAPQPRFPSIWVNHFPQLPLNMSPRTRGRGNKRKQP